MSSGPMTSTSWSGLGQSQAPPPPPSSSGPTSPTSFTGLPTSESKPRRPRSKPRPKPPSTPPPSSPVVVESTPPSSSNGPMTSTSWSGLGQSQAPPPPSSSNGPMTSTKPDFTTRTTQSIDPSVQAVISQRSSSPTSPATQSRPVTVTPPVSERVAGSSSISLFKDKVRSRYSTIVQGVKDKWFVSEDFNPEVNQGTRTDLASPLLFSNQEPETPAYRTPDGSFSLFKEDPRSRYSITVQGIKDKLFTQEDTSPLTVKETVVAPVALAVGAGKAGVEFGKGFLGAGYTLVRGVTWGLPETVESVLNPVASVITGEQTVKDIGRGAQSAISQSFQDNPARFAGGLAFDVFAPKLATKGWSLAKDAYVRVGSTRIPPENVFAKSVLSGAESTPTSPSTAESLARFQQADNIVQTSAPAKIIGKEAGTGRKGGVGLEDTGIYVTPAGEGSPTFLRIDPSSSVYEFSLNPFKGSGGLTDVPTVTRFKTAGVELYPQIVLDSPGFSAVYEFQRLQAGSGKAFITKRSMIGQGDVPRSQLTVTGDLVTEGGLNVKKGDVRWTAGTSEVEAVVPATQQFTYTPTTRLGKIKGFDTYTEFGGRPVAIRDAVLTTDNIVLPESAIASITPPPPKPTILAPEKLLSEQSYLSSSQVKTVSPPLFSSLSVPPSQVLPAPAVSSFSVSNSFSQPVLPVSPVLPPSSPVVVSPSPSPSTPIGSPSPTPSRPGGSSFVSSPSPSPSTPIGSPSPTPSRPGGSSFVSSPSPFPPGSRPPVIRYPRITSRFDRSPQKNLFVSEVKRRGVFLRTGGPTSYEQAWNKGLRGIRDTASASFRIIDTRTGQAVRPSTGRFTKDLRLSKVDPSVVVERRRYRISSPGEKRDITYKGVFASTSKKRRFNLWE